MSSTAAIYEYIHYYLIEDNIIAYDQITPALCNKYLDQITLDVMSKYEKVSLCWIIDIINEVFCDKVMNSQN